MDVQWRREYKHLINHAERLILEQRLSVLMSRDSNCTGNSTTYHIRSLYFENDANKILQEKLSGLAQRDKYRIRYYNFDSSYIRLEKKSKRSAYGHKFGCLLTKEQCRKIMEGNISWMQSAEHPLLRDTYLAMTLYRLKPAVIVDYVREAFVHSMGNVRITLDSDLRSSMVTNGFFSKDLPTLSILQPGLTVLEVKYDEYLPDFIGQAIQIGNRKDQAISKYTASRIYG